MSLQVREEFVLVRAGIEEPEIPAGETQDLLLAVPAQIKECLVGINDPEVLLSAEDLGIRVVIEELLESNLLPDLVVEQ